MAGPAEGFTAREAARITGLSVERVRRLARHGVLPSADDSRLTFRDLVLLRQVKSLLDAGVTLRRIRHACTSLRAAGQALPRLFAIDGGAGIIADGAGVCWEVGSGQLLLPYAAKRATTRVVFTLQRRPDGAGLTAEQWYELGVDLEATSFAGAIDAYRNALAQDADFCEARINLGRLLHVSGSLLEAKALYEKAMRADPLDPIPAFNLGVVLEDLGFGDDAVRAYRSALRRDPSFADAHYNLALVYERKGSPVQALKHARRYRELTGSGSGDSR